MTVSVQFPDGAVRHVPGQLKTIQASEDAQNCAYEQVPINCDPQWVYEQQGRQWIARRRTQRVTTLRTPVEEWWQSIGYMADEPPVIGPEQDDRTTGTPEGDTARSAA